MLRNVKTIYTAAILITTTIFVCTSNVEAENTGNDLIVLIKDATSNPTIAKLALNGTNYLELCQSGKCNITYSDSSPYTNTPTPDNQFMSYSIDFKIIDSVPQKNIGPKKKEFLEKFSSALLACKVDNIVEDNNQEAILLP